MAYGSQAVRSFLDNGEPDRGLRRIDPAEAAVVRRILRDHAAGHSPLVIARALNEEGVAGPSGGIWHDPTIRGRPKRGDGILRNSLYAGQLVWNKFRNTRDPITGSVQHRADGSDTVVIQEVPDLRIVEQVLWDHVQARLATETSAPSKQTHQPGPANRFWERRRPKHLLTGKVECGACSAT